MSKTFEDIITAPSIVREQWLSPELAVREVLAFERRFGSKHLMLACHAALPLILTPELLNLIHINFLEEEQISWVAEVDFLLSPLCRPIDESLFEVEPSIREVLLVDMENQFGFERPLRLAEFLQFYLEHKSGLKQRSEITRTQRWIAQAYIEPDRVIEELLDLQESDLSQPDYLVSVSEQIQIINILEILAEPLERANQQTKYKYLINNSRVVAQSIYGYVDKTIVQQKNIENLRQSETREREKALELALQELQQTQVKLIQYEKMSSVGQLIAGIVHEINNPISFIYGNVVHVNEYTQDLLNLINLYQKHYPNPPTEIQQVLDDCDIELLIEDLPRVLSSIKVGAERIRQILLSLQNVLSLDKTDMKSVDIHEGIEATLLILQHQLKAKYARPDIQVIKEYGNLPLVECYAGQLNQVFMNLLSNAIDALEQSPSPGEQSRRANPTIRINTSVQGENVVIRIADNGSGMSQEIVSKIFDFFFTTKPVGKGTGLGLSISYQIVVDKHGGQLSCVSEPGEGAEFVIEIPISARIPYKNKQELELKVKREEIGIENLKKDVTVVSPRILEWLVDVEQITVHREEINSLRQSETREREKARQLELALQELQQTQAKLIQSEKMSTLGQLIAGIVHEINNPISFINANLPHASEYTQNLLNLINFYQKHYPNPPKTVEDYDIDFLIEDLPKLFSSIKRGAERIRQIVLSLKNFSRLDEAE
jgi:signal transduction histidine kinase